MSHTTDWAPSKSRGGHNKMNEDLVITCHVIVGFGGLGEMKCTTGAVSHADQMDDG